MEMIKLLPLLELLENNKKVEQDPKWHPEGNAYNHSVQCFELAMKNSQDMDVILAALFHDLGKQKESHGHEQHSYYMCKNYLSTKSLWLIKNHMRINYLLSGKMKKANKIASLRDNPWFNELLELNVYDKMARMKDYYYHFDFVNSPIMKALNEKLKNYEPLREEK